MSIITNGYLVSGGVLVGIILGALAGGIIIGLGLFLLITKLKNRNKSRKVKVDSKTSDYQFQFKLNTGHFINNLKESDSDKRE